MSINFVLSDIFQRVVGFGEEDNKGNMAFSKHHVKDSWCQHDLPLIMLTELIFIII